MPGRPDAAPSAREGAHFQPRTEPIFADFCSGVRAPVSFALAWCGWQVSAYDIEFGADLSSEVHDRVWKQRDSVLVRLWACPCSTFSRAREKSLGYSADGGPPILRSDSHPKGVPGLSPRDQARVDKDTLLAVRAADWAKHSLATGGTLTIIENPRNSLLWALPEHQSLQEQADWRSVDYDACCFQGARRKAQTLRSNSDLLDQLACHCSHIHDADEWRRRGDFATAEEKEYTAHFAYALAACITAWAVQRGGLPLAIPRLMPPSPSGSRQGWADMEFQSTREWAMIAEGVRLCLEPPAESPGVWYPKFATAANIAWRGTPDCELRGNNLPDRVVLTPSRQRITGDLYIGRGEAFPPYTSKSKWHNPFKVSQFGRQAALKKYQEHVESSP